MCRLGTAERILRGTRLDSGRRRQWRRVDVARLLAGHTPPCLTEVLHQLAPFTREREATLLARVSQPAARNSHLDGALHLRTATGVAATQLVGLVHLLGGLLSCALDAVRPQTHLVIEVGTHDAEGVVHADLDLAVLVVKRVVGHAFSSRGLSRHR